jgi:hypothetical protein
VWASLWKDKLVTHSSFPDRIGKKSASGINTKSLFIYIALFRFATCPKLCGLFLVN